VKKFGKEIESNVLTAPLIETSSEYWTDGEHTYKHDVTPFP
jgi:hypothetical protein